MSGKALSCIMFSLAGVSIFILNYFGDKVAAGPLAGVIIGSGFTFAINHYLAGQASKKNRTSLIEALLAEIESLLQLIDDRRNKINELRASGLGHLASIPIADDYFTVFSRNADKLGILPNETARIIIMAYIETKGLFDTVKHVSSENKITKDLWHRMTCIEMAASADPDYLTIQAEYQQRTGLADGSLTYLMDHYVPQVVGILESARNALLQEKNKA